MVKKAAIIRMIHKEGRKPYDPTELRYAEGPYENREPPDNYISKQKEINSGPDGTINPQKLRDYTDQLKLRGFIKIKPHEIYDIQPGARIAYIRTDKKWCSGGFLISIHDSNTQYNSSKTSNEYETYLLYKSFNNAVFSLQLKDVIQFWILEKKLKEDENTFVIFKKPMFYTNFPVTLKNSDEIDTVIYFARDSYVRNRFMSTDKFRRAQEYGWMFEDNTQENTINFEI